jgi:hypothetical protein
MMVAESASADGIVIVGARVVFKIAKSVKETSADVTVYNLSPATRAAMGKGKILYLYAGYEKQNGLIFAGEVTAVSTEYDTVDRKTVVKARGGAFNFRSYVISEAFPPDSTALSILNRLSSQAGAPVEIDTTGVTDRPYPAGYSVLTTVEKAMVDVAARIECRVIHRGSSLLVQHKDSTQKAPVVFLTPETGLLGYPSRIEKQADTPKKEAKGAAVDVFKPDGTVDIAKVAALAKSKVATETGGGGAGSGAGLFDPAKIAKDIIDKATKPKLQENKPVQMIKGWGINCLLDCRIEVGEFVRVKDEMIGDKSYRAEEVEHSGDTDGNDWKTSIKVYGI